MLTIFQCDKRIPESMSLVEEIFNDNLTAVEIERGLFEN